MKKWDEDVITGKLRDERAMEERKAVEVIKEFNSYSLLRRKQVDNASFNMLHKLDFLLNYKNQVHLLCRFKWHKSFDYIYIGGQ